MRKISNKQTKDFIADIIKANIIEGNLKEDDDITQEVLAEILNVSRMPVREAIQDLTQEGFMEKLPNRRVRIVKLDNEQIREVLLLSATIENQILNLSKTNAEKLNSLVSIKDELEKTTSIENFRTFEINFHEVLLETLDNKYISLIFNKILNGYVVYAINNFGTIEDKKKMLKNILNKVIINNTNEIEKALEEYFLYYAEKFKTELR